VKDTVAPRRPGHERHRHRRAGLHPRGDRRDKRAQQIIDDELKRYRLDLNDQLRSSRPTPSTDREAAGRQARQRRPAKIAKGTDDRQGLPDRRRARYHWFDIRPADEDLANQLESIKNSLEQTRHSLRPRLRGEEKKLTQGDELPAACSKMVKVYLAVKRPPAARRQDGRPPRQQGRGVADRAGRGHAVHGRRPSGRHRAESARRAVADERRARSSRRTSGWAAKGIGLRIGEMLARQARRRVRQMLDRSTTSTARRPSSTRSTTARVVELAQNLANGVPFATPVFDGASEEEIRAMLDIAFPDDDREHREARLQRAQDPAAAVRRRTGEPFERR
jgi:DNA-directed RNA polymerase subunit beta